MRRIGFAVLSIGLALLVFMQGASQARADERIRQLDTDITIRQDGWIEVVETIEYDFDTLQKHGIYRTIPKIRPNAEGEEYRMDYKLVNVTDELGNPYTVVNESDSRDFTLKIGDADRTITGRHTYVIRYNVGGALTYFSDHDELYWNLTGTEWTVPIWSASASVHLPTDIPTGEINTTCYTGYTGSANQNCQSNIRDHTVSFSTDELLLANQGLTGVVGFPIGHVEILEATRVVSFWSTIWGKLVIGLLILLGLLYYLIWPAWIFRSWLKHGRDPKGTMGVTSAWFEPPKSPKGRDLLPAEVGGVVDEKVEHREVTATLIQLAQRGHLRIEEAKKNKFTLRRMTEASEWKDLEPYEKTLLDGVFNDGKKDSYELESAQLVNTVNQVKQGVYTTLVAQGFFPEDPSKTRTIYSVIGGLALATFNLPLAIAAFSFGRHMARKTITGVDAANVGKSLKNFLSSQERTLEHQAKTQEFFEKLLPHAIAFGVEKIWAKRFEDINLEPRDWYTSYDNRLWTAAALSSSMNRACSSVRSAATPVSSSSGHSSGFSGGSSGGGGGGGGGGSW